MSFKESQRKNPDFHIQSITESTFQTYGKIINEDIQEALSYVSTNVHPPKNGNSYAPSVLELEKMSCIKKLSDKVYGYLDVIAGIVTGDNDVLNGIEYHQGSETIIAVTDYILAVGHLWDMKNNIYDSSLCELFYVPEGTIVEVYSTTLHYTPICANEKFMTICLLLKGTSDTCQRQGILKKKNKWFIAHQENIEKVQLGDFPGLIGEMIKINKSNSL